MTGADTSKLILKEPEAPLEKKPLIDPSSRIAILGNHVKHHASTKKKYLVGAALAVILLVVTLGFVGKGIMKYH